MPTRKYAALIHIIMFGEKVDFSKSDKIIKNEKVDKTST